jgi:hypothetical protein
MKQGVAKTFPFETVNLIVSMGQGDLLLDERGCIVRCVNV